MDEITWVIQYANNRVCFYHWARTWLERYVYFEEFRDKLEPCDYFTDMEGVTDGVRYKGYA